MDVGDELLDVVDAQDRVVGQARRRDIHAQGLLHRAVHMLVFNAQGQVYLQMRSAQKDQHASKWGTSAAGHVDAGETYDTAACREMQEELGLTNVPLEPLFRLEACEASGDEFVQVYRCAAEGPFTLDPAESDYGQWFTPAEVRHLLADPVAPVTPSLRLVWETLQAR